MNKTPPYVRRLGIGVLATTVLAGASYCTYSLNQTLSQPLPEHVELAAKARSTAQDLRPYLMRLHTPIGNEGFQANVELMDSTYTALGEQLEELRRSVTQTPKTRQPRTRE